MHWEMCEELGWRGMIVVDLLLHVMF
jgi:hypothetical protein